MPSNQSDEDELLLHNDDDDDERLLDLRFEDNENFDRLIDFHFQDDDDDEPLIVLWSSEIGKFITFSQEGNTALSTEEEKTR